MSLASALALLLLGGCTAAPVMRETPEPGPIRLPDSHFTRNVGQVERGEVDFYHTSPGLQVGFGRSAITIRLLQEGDLLSGVNVVLKFPGANGVRPQGREKLGFAMNYLRGSDPGRWHTDVPSYREVIYEDLYDGIDLVYRVGKGRLKYEFHVSPGADPEAIEIAYEGIESLQIDPDGDLVVGTVIGEMRDTRPICFLRGESRGAFSEVLRPAAPSGIQGRYVIRSPESLGFSIEGWDGRRPLVIDPLIYSTYLGGRKTEFPRTIVVNDKGEMYLGGWTNSDDFPVSPGGFQTDRGDDDAKDAFVAKLSRKGKLLLWATFLGGNELDDVLDLEVDSRGQIYVTGITQSTDFPVTDGSANHGGPLDAFIAKLDITGRRLLYSSYIGGSHDEHSYAMDIDDTGTVWLAGDTRSDDFPVTAGAYDTVFDGGGFDAWAAEVDTNGAGIIWATYVGGSRVDFCFAMTTGSDGSVYLGGSTNSATDFPVTPGAFDETYNGVQDAYVAKLGAGGGYLDYATYVGGVRFERIFEIAVDAAGAAYVVGTTQSPDFPVTPGAYDQIFDGKNDAFLVKVNPAGSDLDISTYLGGIEHDEAHAIVLAPGDEIILTGFTRSPGFPVTTGAFDETHNGADDVFLTRLTSDGSGLVESTFLGGSALDRGFAVALDLDGNVYVAGETRSADFPVTDKAHDQDKNGVRDGFITKFSP